MKVHYCATLFPVLSPSLFLSHTHTYETQSLSAAFFKQTIRYKKKKNNKKTKPVQSDRNTWKYSMINEYFL